MWVQPTRQKISLVLPASLLLLLPEVIYSIFHESEGLILKNLSIARVHHWITSLLHFLNISVDFQNIRGYQRVVVGGFAPYA